MKRSLGVMVSVAICSLAACGDSSQDTKVIYIHDQGDADDVDGSAMETHDAAACPDASAPDAPKPDAAPACGWEPYNDGLQGGYITDVAFDPRTPGVAWATSAAHLYRSTDHGATWTPRSALTTAGFQQLAFPSDSPNHILAATTGGVLNSDDGGLTWTESLGGLHVQSILAHPADPLRVYVGTVGAGIMRSDDGGKNWWPVNYQVPYAAVNWLEGDPTNRDVVVAGTDLLDATGNLRWAGTILRTADGGASWATEVTGNVVYRVQACPTNHALIYAVTADGIMRSSDVGTTWTMVKPSHIAIDVAIAPTDCNTAYMTTWGDAMRLSTDGGATFGGPLANGIPFANAFPRKVSVDPTDATRVLGATPGGLLLSTNAGGQWTVVGGPMGLSIRSLATSPTAPGKLWMGTWGAQSFVRDGANAWARVPLRVDYVFDVVPDPAVANRTFFGTWSPIIVTNDGTTFATTSVLDNPMAFAFDPSASNTVYAATELGGVYKSINGGGTWTASNNGMSPFMDGNGNYIDVRSIHVDASSTRRVFTGAYQHGLWISNDGAGSWTQSAYLPFTSCLGDRLKSGQTRSSENRPTSRRSETESLYS